MPMTASSTGKRGPAASDARQELSIVDIHAHYMPPTLLREMERAGRIGPVPDLGLSDAKGISSIPVADLDARADWMRRHDIRLQMLGPEMRFALYDLPPSEGTTWARRMNQMMVGAASGYGLFAVLATLPMQDGPGAARELEYAVKDLGCRGAMVHSRVPTGLHDRRLDPLWSTASELAVPVVVHSGVPYEDPRLAEFQLTSGVGRPHEITVAACQLIFGGVLERFRGLVPVLLMAGGTLPYLIARLDAVSAGRTHQIGPVKPSAYLNRFYFDSLAYGPQQLDLLLTLVGPDRLMVGTDWPIDPHESSPRELFENQELATHDRQRVLAANATELFRLGDLTGEAIGHA